MTTILVVEDEQPIRQVIGSMLAAEGYTVWYANDGGEALRQLDYQCPDLLLTDLLMPLVSGAELCHQLKRNPKYARLPIVLMSAASKRPAPGSCPHDRFLPKPFDIDVLVRLVKALL